MSHTELDTMLAAWLARGNVITVCAPARAKGAYRGDVVRSGGIRTQAGSIVRGYRWL